MLRMRVELPGWGGKNRVAVVIATGCRWEGTRQGFVENGIPHTSPEPSDNHWWNLNRQGSNFLPLFFFNVYRA